MRAPGSRGAEPRTSATDTSAHRPCTSSISATRDQIRTVATSEPHAFENGRPNLANRSTESVPSPRSYAMMPPRLVLRQV